MFCHISFYTSNTLRCSDYTMFFLLMFRFFLETDYILEYVISFRKFRILTRNNDFFEKYDICKQPFINLNILGLLFSEEK